MSGIQYGPAAVPGAEPSRETDDPYRLLAKAAQDAIVLIDDDLRITHWNPAAERIFGYSPEEVVGRTVTELLVPPEDRVAVNAALARFRSGEDGSRLGLTREMAALRKGGEEIPIELSVSGVHIDGRPHTIAIARDISRRRTAEFALARQTADLARSNAELEQFASVASHDLQEPLRMVLGFLQLLRARTVGRLDEEEAEFLEYALDGAERMQAMIRDLLAWCRVGIQKDDFAPVSMEDVLSRALVHLGPALEECSAEVTHGPLPSVAGDYTQLLQLLQNVISNAIKFRSEEPPRVRVEAEATSDAWLFRVRDNGVGIAAAHLERVFAVFQRLHSTTRYPGTGIGLAICRKVVERHGGRIWIESAAGSGTTVLFTIPRDHRDLSRSSSVE